MIDNATHMQMSHCWISRLVVSSSLWNGPSTVARMSVSTDPPVAQANVLSENVSRVKTVRRSSQVANEKKNHSARGGSYQSDEWPERKQSSN